MPTIAYSRVRGCGAADIARSKKQHDRRAGRLAFVVAANGVRMLVSVTGGTGFVGSHSVAAVIAAGHRVRLLTRNPRAVPEVLRPLGVDPAGVEVVAGAATDPGRVAELVRGADAVLHAAGVYSFDRRRRREMRRTNELATEAVLGAARKAGVGRVVHVSSFVALGGTVLDENSPVTSSSEPYAASKAAAEEVAREHGAVISYPPALLGPHDPRLGDQTARLRATLRGLMPIWPTGGFPLGDVRDTAAMHARLLTGGPSRCFGPGRFVSTRDYVRTLREVTGRRLPAVFLPAAALVPVGVAADALQRVWPWPVPVQGGAIRTCLAAQSTASSGPVRPLAETMADTVRWLRDAGRVA
ncbi:NAD-dependent epimerase/dehydratase family protein [Lentzea sp. CC55]|uniref:NAD-dependent epimerase/dehydratase family protein n=1 Tax=Lentzea sp. CC55 TaxID=2884909 RepID=UPI0027DFA9E3|nr:NAD-dependent epimerase/dehydratase family protein [Lentzea sp. CC55]